MFIMWAVVCGLGSRDCFNEATTKIRMNVEPITLMQCQLGTQQVMAAEWADMLRSEDGSRVELICREEKR